MRTIRLRRRAERGAATQAGTKILKLTQHRRRAALLGTAGSMGSHDRQQPQSPPKPGSCFAAERALALPLRCGCWAAWRRRSSTRPRRWSSPMRLRAGSLIRPAPGRPRHDCRRPGQHPGAACANPGAPVAAGTRQPLRDDEPAAGGHGERRTRTRLAKQLHRQPAAGSVRRLMAPASTGNGDRLLQVSVDSSDHSHWGDAH